jgi:mono/diheme cytochrome c family protein
MRPPTLAAVVMLAAVHLAMAGLDAAQSKTAAVTPNAPAATPKTIAAGEKLFRAHCSRCHGSDARGDGPEAPPGSHPPNLTDDTWLHGSTDGDILNVIRNGVGPKFDMKGFRSRFTTDEMWSLVHYLRSIHASGSR